MNKTVSFELGKLLKEKDFKKKCTSFYDLISNTQIDNAPLGNYNLTKQSVSIPTISEVIMWLYEKHGIWIYTSDNSTRLGFRCQIQRLKILGEDNFSSEERYDSPTEAYEAAIEYTLKNLL